MSNTYYKILNSKVVSNYSDDIVSGLQKDLVDAAKLLNGDLYDMVNALKMNSAGNLDINLLLKFYTINQLLKDTNEPQRPLPKEDNYLPTPNPNYKKDSEENKYYRKDKNMNWVLDKDVISVENDGSYVKQEMYKHSLYKLRKTYSTDDSLVSIQLIDPQNKVVRSKMQVVEFLGMRKEYVQRYKYSGFSGNSSDIIASIKNKIFAPIESGYYMDSYYNLYKWNENMKCFQKSYVQENMSPLLTDYDFEQARKVVRKEYTGIS